MQDKINVNLEVTSSVANNVKSVNDDLFVNVYCEGSLVTRFSALINSGLIPSYFDDLSTNTNRIYERLSKIETIINEYAGALSVAEEEISSKAESTIITDLTIKSLTFKAISFVNKTLYNFKNIGESIQNLATIFVTASTASAVDLIDELAKEYNVPIEEILSGESNDILNAGINKIDNLGDLSLTLGKVDEVKLQSYLSAVLNGEYDGFSATSSVALSSLFYHLNNLANDKGLTIDQLLEDKGNAPLLKETISNIGNSLGSGNTDEVVSKKIEEYAKNNNLTLDQLLSGENKDTLTSYILKLDKVSDISTIFKKMNQQELSTYLNDIYNSGQAKESTSLSVVFEYLDLVSKNNSITVSNLLTDSNYTQILEDSLTNLNMQFTGK